MSFVRVRPTSEGGPVAVRHPVHGELVVPKPGDPFRSDDPLVKAYPWLFRADVELVEHKDPESVRIEDASNRPGSRRGGRR